MPSIYDAMFDGTFDALGVPSNYSQPGNTGTPYRAEDYAPIYQNLPPPAPVGSPYMTAAERSQLEQQMATSRALQAAQPGIAAQSMYANAPMPRARPGNAPSRMDIAAMGSQQHMDALDAIMRGLALGTKAGALTAVN